MEFPKNEYDLLEPHLSKERLQRYLLATDFDPKRAIQLYELNLLASSRMHPLLGLTEVILRNNLYRIMTSQYGPQWLLTEQKGFMDVPGLSYLVQETRKAQSRAGGQSASIGKIISELPFGFWVALLDTKYYKSAKGLAIRAFPHLSPGISRSVVHGKLMLVRDFRNRINHNEPIVLIKGNTLPSLSYIQLIKETIYELLNWIDRDLAIWAGKMDEIDQITLD